MSKRKSEDPTASLELLLDTICNTFGGVLFISMLVVVILNGTTREVAIQPPTESAKAAMAAELADANAEMARMQAALREQVKTLAAIGVDPRLEELARKLKDGRQERAALLERKGQTLADTTRSQEQVNRIAGDLQQLQRAIDEANRRLLELDRELQERLRLQSRTAELPRAERTTKVEAPFFLSGGRLTPLTRLGAGGSLTPNRGEFEETTEGGVTFLAPRPGAGVRVDGNDADTQAGRVFAPFDSNRFYVAVWVWPDSFNAFTVVRQVLVRNGFKYRLVPLPSGQKVGISRGGQSDVLVQ